jgi:hypothetical protein
MSRSTRYSVDLRSASSFMGRPKEAIVLEVGGGVGK